MMVRESVGCDAVYREVTAATLGLGKAKMAVNQLANLAEQSKQHAEAAWSYAQQIPQPTRGVGVAGRIAYENDVRARVEARDALENAVTAMDALLAKVNALVAAVGVASKMGGVAASAATHGACVTETADALVSVTASTVEISKGATDTARFAHEAAMIAEAAAIRARWTVGRETVITSRKAAELAFAVLKHCTTAAADARSARRMGGSP